MKSRLLSALGACVITLSAISTANAALTDIGGGMIYDDDLDITWLANANFANGAMNWADSTAWAAGLTVGGYNNWRLPTALNQDGSGPCEDFYNCAGSEMGHLFYNELGGTANNSILTSSDPDLALFSNILASQFYWASTEFVANPFSAWGFEFQFGSQGLTNKNVQSGVGAWAVADGNVSAVPVPAAVWLFGSGLIGLVGIARRKKAA